MKQTQRLIIIDGYNTDEERQLIAGFAAVQVVYMIDQALLSTIFYHNKNAVFFSGPRMELSYEYLNPLHIHLSRTASFSYEDAVICKKDNLVKDFARMLDHYGIDAGDHCSEDSTNLDEYDETNCLLCKIRDRRNEKPEHILFETEHFYVVPGAGALIDGYIMLVPKTHVLSFAALPEEQREEFFLVLYAIKSIVSAIYKKPVIAFENGTGRFGGGKHETSILHAHFHFMPIDLNILKAVQKVGVHPTYIEENELFKYGTYPYRLIIDQRNNWFIASDADDYYPRQLVRQVVADHIGLEEGAYNWRSHPDREKMDQIAETFRAYCSSHFNTLPKWVRKSVVLHD